MTTDRQEAPTTSRRLRCPACSGPMDLFDRQGVEIERCAECRGVWLDRGELEKLISWETNHSHKSDYEHPVEDGEEVEAGDRLATRRSFFAELFDFE